MAVTPEDALISEAIDLFGRNVRRRRLELDLTQAAAAARAGISQSNWSKVERGEIEPSIAQMLRIHVALEGDSLESYFGAHPSIRLVGGRR